MTGSSIGDDSSELGPDSSRVVRRDGSAGGDSSSGPYAARKSSFRALTAPFGSQKMTVTVPQGESPGDRLVVWANVRMAVNVAVSAGFGCEFEVVPGTVRVLEWTERQMVDSDEGSLLSWPDGSPVVHAAWEDADGGAAAFGFDFAAGFVGVEQPVVIYRAPSSETTAEVAKSLAGVAERLLLEQRARRNARDGV